MSLLRSGGCFFWAYNLPVKGAVRCLYLFPGEGSFFSHFVYLTADLTGKRVWIWQVKLYFAGSREKIEAVITCGTVQVENPKMDPTQGKPEVSTSSRVLIKTQ